MTTRLIGIMIVVTSLTAIYLSVGEHFAQAQLSSGGAVSFAPSAPVRSEQSDELLSLEKRSQDLAAALRAKPDATMEAELKKLVGESFDLRHAVQVAEAKALEARLAKLQDTLKKREQKKSEIVERRVKQLLREADDLDWNVPAPGSSIRSTIGASTGMDRRGR